MVGLRKFLRIEFYNSNDLLLLGRYLLLSKAAEYMVGTLFTILA